MVDLSNTTRKLIKDYAIETFNRMKDHPKFVENVYDGLESTLGIIKYNLSIPKYHRFTVILENLFNLRYYYRQLIELIINENTKN